MTTIIPVPMRVSQGEPFSYEFTVTGQNWTGWTGTATFKRAVKAVTENDQQIEPLLTVSVTGNSAGLIQLALTAAETATFPALPRLGFFRQAVCEVSMTNGANVKKYQIRVLVAATI